VGGLIGQCVPPNRGERSTRMQTITFELARLIITVYLKATQQTVDGQTDGQRTMTRVGSFL